jgi:hypothetical protein
VKKTPEPINEGFSLEAFLLPEKHPEYKEPMPGWDPEGKHKGSESERDFAGQLYDRIAEDNPSGIRELLSKKLDGKILIDLGNAGVSKRYVSEWERLGVKAYIGVDLYNPQQHSAGANPRRDVLPETEKHIYGNFPVSQIHADMHEFLAHVPDNSACIMINGIDAAVLASPTFAPLLKEMERVCVPGGIIFGKATQFLSALKNNPHFIDHAPDASETYGIEMYEKKKSANHVTARIAKTKKAATKVIKKHS